MFHRPFSVKLSKVPKTHILKGIYAPISTGVRRLSVFEDLVLSDLGAYISLAFNGNYASKSLLKVLLSHTETQKTLGS